MKVFLKSNTIRRTYLCTFAQCYYSKYITKYNDEKKSLFTVQRKRLSFKNDIEEVVGKKIARNHIQTFVMLQLHTWLTHYGMNTEFV